MDPVLCDILTAYGLDAKDDDIKKAYDDAFDLMVKKFRPPSPAPAIQEPLVSKQTYSSPQNNVHNDRSLQQHVHPTLTPSGNQSARVIERKAETAPKPGQLLPLVKHPMNKLVLDTLEFKGVFVKKYIYLRRRAKDIHVYVNVRDHAKRVCLECNRFFDGAHFLAIHFARNDLKPGTGFLRCHECGLQMMNNCALCAHSRVHQCNRPFTCFVCGTLFRDAGEKLFLQHIQSHGFQAELVALYCTDHDTHFNTYQEYHAHISKHPGFSSEKVAALGMTSISTKHDHHKCSTPTRSSKPQVHPSQEPAKAKCPLCQEFRGTKEEIVGHIKRCNRVQPVKASNIVAKHNQQKQMQLQQRQQQQYRQQQQQRQQHEHPHTPQHQHVCRDYGLCHLCGKLVCKDTQHFQMHLQNCTRTRPVGKPPVETSQQHYHQPVPEPKPKEVNHSSQKAKRPIVEQVTLSSESASDEEVVSPSKRSSFHCDKCKTNFRSKYTFTKHQERDECVETKPLDLKKDKADAQQPELD